MISGGLFQPLQFCDSVKCRCWCYHRQWMLGDCCSTSISMFANGAWVFLLQCTHLVSFPHWGSVASVIINFIASVIRNMSSFRFSALECPPGIPKRRAVRRWMEMYLFKTVKASKWNLLLHGGDITTEMLLRRWSGTARGFSGRWSWPQACWRVWTSFRDMWFDSQIALCGVRSCTRGFSWVLSSSEGCSCMMQPSFAVFTYLLHSSSKTCCSARGAGQRWQFFSEPSYFLQCGSWYKSPLPSLSSSLMHIHQYAERERNPRTNRKARKENETKKAELRAVLSRVMFCWSGRYEQRFIGLFEQELNGVSSLTAE